MRDRNVYGASDSSIQEKLLKETDLSLEKFPGKAELSRKRIKTVSLVQNKSRESI